MVSLSLAALTVAWIVGHLPIDLLVRATRWMAGATLAAAIIERGPGGLTAVEYDRISLPYIVIAGLIWLACEALALAAPWCTSTARRSIAAVTMAICGAVSIRLMFPLILDGPFAGLPEQMFTDWLDGIMESQPVGSGPTGPVRLVFQLGLAVVAAATLVALVIRGRLPQPRAAWLATTGWLVVLVPLAISSMRFTIYPQALAGVAAGAWVVRRLDSTRPRRFPALSRVGWILLATCGYIVPALAVQIIVDPQDKPDPLAECPVGAIAEEIRPLALARSSDESRPLAVFSDLDDGPQLHVVAGVDVLATPHHRNVDGILMSFDLMRLAPEQTKAELIARGIDLVLVCPVRDARRFGTDPGTTVTALIEGPLPGWAQPVAAKNPAWRIFEVRESG